MKFRFQSIFDLRIRQRDEASMELGKVNEAITKIESEITDVDAEQKMILSDTSGRTGEISVDGLLTRGRYALQLTADRQRLAQLLEKLMVELDARQGRLAAAQTEVKKFEMLRDKHFLAIRVEQNRQEQFVLDEAAGRIRQMNKSQT